MVGFQMAARRLSGVWGHLKILCWAGSQPWGRGSCLSRDAQAGFEVSAHSHMVDLRLL